MFANAGRMSYTPLLEMTTERWEEVLQVNLRGVMFCFREAVKHMVDRGGSGKLVAISSVGSMHGMPKGTHYSSSKSALQGLVRSTAVEYAKHDIQANVILPGWITTEMTGPARSWKALEQTIVKRTPAVRWGDPEDFAGIVV